MTPSSFLVRQVHALDTVSNILHLIRDLSLAISSSASLITRFKLMISSWFFIRIKELLLSTRLATIVIWATKHKWVSLASPNTILSHNLQFAVHTENISVSVFAYIWRISSNSTNMSFWTIVSGISLILCKSLFNFFIVRINVWEFVY